MKYTKALVIGWRVRGSPNFLYLVTDQSCSKTVFSTTEIVIWPKPSNIVNRLADFLGRETLARFEIKFGSAER
jgi:hypothetical protein